MAEILVARLGEMALAEEAVAKGTKVVNANLVDGTKSKIRVFDLTYTPDVTIFERNTAGPTLSRYSHLVGQTLGKLSGKCEVRKTAAAGTADAYQLLWQAAGMKLASSIWTRTTDQSLHKTINCYCFMGSSGVATVRIGLRGAMCTSFKFVGKVGQPLMIEWELMGVSSRIAAADADGTPTNTFSLRPTDDVLNTVSHEAGVPNIFQGVAMTVGTGTKRLSTFELDLGLTTAAREDVSSVEGVLHYVITDASPTVTIDPEFGLVGDGTLAGGTGGDDWFTPLNEGEQAALAWSHLCSTSRTMAFAAPKAQITALSPGERNGIKTMGVTMKLNRSTDDVFGDDEFTITES